MHESIILQHLAILHQFTDQSDYNVYILPVFLYSANMWRLQYHNSHQHIDALDTGACAVYCISDTWPQHYGHVQTT